jgi:hypothetical protein
MAAEEYNPFEGEEEAGSDSDSGDECFSDDDVHPVVFDLLKRSGKAELFAGRRRRESRSNPRERTPRIMAVKVITDKAFLELGHLELAMSPVLYVPRSAVKSQGANPAFRNNPIYVRYPETLKEKAKAPARILKRVEAYEHKYNKAQNRFILSLLYRTYMPTRITRDVLKRYPDLPQDYGENIDMSGEEFAALTLEIDPRAEDSEIAYGRLSQSTTGVVARAASMLAEKYWTKGHPSTKCSQRTKLWYCLQQVFKPAVAFRILARFGYFQ